MAIRITVARSSAEKDVVFRLRHHLAVTADSAREAPSGRLVDRFDCVNEAMSFLAWQGSVPSATLRVIPDNPVGLPTEELFDFSAARAERTGAWASWDWPDAGWTSVPHMGTFMGLIKLAVRRLRRARVRYVQLLLTEPARQILSRLGATPVGAPLDDVSPPLVPCVIDLEDFPSGVREDFEDPTNLMLDDSDERVIYEQGEILCREGDEADTALFVMRGSVRVLPRSGQPGPDILFGQGHLLGEVALLDGGTRTSSVVAWSPEVDVMVWHREKFIDQLVHSRERAFELCQLLASRMRQNIDGARLNTPSVLLAQVLLDASRGGTRPVNVEWLARQCGVWGGDLREVVQDWVDMGWIDLQGPQDLVVLAPARLAAFTHV